MPIARQYVMVAKPDQSADMETELTALADVVRALPGSEGVELLRDCGDECRFVFTERWESMEAHKAAGTQIPRDLIGRLMAASAKPLDGAYLSYVKTV